MHRAEAPKYLHGLLITSRNTDYRCGSLTDAVRGMLENAGRKECHSASGACRDSRAEEDKGVLFPYCFQGDVRDRGSPMTIRLSDCCGWVE